MLLTYYSQDKLAPPLVTMFRFLLATIFFIPAFISYFNSKPVDYGAFVGSLELGLYCAVGFIAQAQILQYTSASKAAFSCGLGVIMPPLFDLIHSTFKGKSTIDQHNNARKNKTTMELKDSPFVPPLIALVGAAILELHGLNEPAKLSDIYLLITPINFAMCFWKSEKHSRKYPNHTELITATMLLSVTVITLIWTLLTGTLPCDKVSFVQLIKVFYDWKVASALLFTGIMTTAWTSYIEQNVLKVLSAADTTVIYSLEPIFATFFAWVILKEKVSSATLIGAVFIFIATLWKPLIRNRCKQ